MSAHRNMFSGVEMVILMRVLSVVIYAVGVITSTGYSIRLPPTLSIVLWVSDFCSFMSQIILPYVTFRYCGTCAFGMKKIIFDPENMLPTTCASLPNQLEKYLRQNILSYPLTKCLYSCANIVSGWTT